MKLRVLLGIGIGLVLLLVGVVAYKPALFYLFQTTYPLLFESDLITRPDPRFGMDLVPGLKDARLVAPARPHTTHEAQTPTLRNRIKRKLVFFTDTNPAGFRGPLVPLERSSGGFRIAFLGDSITFGWGVPEEESYAGYVRKMLPPLLPGRAVEVINGGIPGFPLVQIPSILRHKIAPYRPDVVCVMKYGAAHSPNALEEFRQHLHRVHSEAQAIGAKLLLTVPPISSFDTTALSWRFGEVLEEVGRELQVPTINFGTLFKKAGEGRGLKLEREGDRQRLVRYVDGRREVVVEVAAPGDRHAVAREIYDYLDGTTESEALFLDGGHPDVEGNQLIARHIVEMLQTQGWLTASRP